MIFVVLFQIIITGYAWLCADGRYYYKENRITSYNVCYTKLLRFLPVISKDHQDIPSQWKTLEGKSVTLQDKITILGFPGDNIMEVKGNLFNLNQKIYNKYFGFKDFQMVMVMPKGTEKDCQKILRKLESVTEDLSGWNFVFTTPDSLQHYYDTFVITSYSIHYTKLYESPPTPASSCNWR